MEIATFPDPPRVRLDDINCEGCRVAVGDQFQVYSATGYFSETLYTPSSIHGTTRYTLLQTPSDIKPSTLDPTLFIRKLWLNIEVGSLQP